LFLRDPRGLENLHATMEVTRRRKYEYFLTDAYPIPRFDSPTLDQQRELERQLSDFYSAWGRASAVKVCSFFQPRVLHGAPEWLFLVQHTAPLRREEALQKGVPRPLVFRPWIYSRLKYDTMRGEVGVSCSSDHERMVLLKIFGRVLFGRDNYFPIKGKYDL